MSVQSEFRIRARLSNKAPFERVIRASSLSEAKRKAKEFLNNRGGTLISVEKRRLYKFTAASGRSTIEGTQRAFNRDEVVKALMSTGLKVKKVSLQFEFQGKAPSAEIVGFIAQSAKLLEQKLPFQEVLLLMQSNVKNPALKGALRDIIADLKTGMDSRDAFGRQSKILGEHVALLLGIATKSGNMTSIFESVAMLVERQADFRKGLTTALLVPMVTFVTIIGALLFYVVYLIPQMTEALGPMLKELPPLTAASVQFSYFLQDNFWWMGILTTLIVGGFYFFISTPEGKIWRDKSIVKIPYIGRILRDTSLEVFCRVLGIMYTSAGENIDAIQIASEASGNSYFARQIRTVAIPAMLKYGTELGKALETTKFMPDLALSRFKTGSETGSVKSTALQLADYYRMENGYAMKNLANAIELMVTLLITVTLGFLTFLSSETASLKLEGMS